MNLQIEAFWTDLGILNNNSSKYATEQLAVFLLFLPQDMRICEDNAKEGLKKGDHSIVF